MNQATAIFGKSMKRAHPIATASIVLLLSSTAAFAQFHATPDIDGNVTVYDADGVEVEIAPAEPVGIRPMVCPSGAYYVSEVPSDKTELVLTDCTTSQHNYTVEMQGLPD
jgi:hypothetical protein